MPEHFVERKPLILENLMNASYQGNNPLTLLCIGDVIAILTLATVVIFLSLLIKPFFLKQKPPKQHFKMLFLIRFGNIWSIKIFQKFCKILRCPHHTYAERSSCFIALFLPIAATTVLDSLILLMALWTPSLKNLDEIPSSPETSKLRKKKRNKQH